MTSPPNISLRSLTCRCNITVTANVYISSCRRCNCHSVIYTPWKMVVSPTTVCNIVAIGKMAGVDFKKAQIQMKEAKSSQSPHPSQSSRKRYRRRKKSSTSLFNGAVIRLPSLCTCLLFPNGAVTAVGIKSLDNIDVITQRLIDILPACNSTTVKCENPLRVCNIVGSTDMCQRVDLHRLYNSLKSRQFMTYTPETFPGLKISLSKPIFNTRFSKLPREPPSKNMVAIVFYSGKIIITGAKCMSDLENGNKTIQKMIYSGIATMNAGDSMFN